MGTKPRGDLRLIPRRVQVAAQPERALRAAVFLSSIHPCQWRMQNFFFPLEGTGKVVRSGDRPPGSCALHEAALSSVGFRPCCAGAALTTPPVTQGTARMNSPHLIVADHQFILATRDTGYRGLANAVAELIDNAIQARASDVRVHVRDSIAANGRADGDRDVAIAVLDNGQGMDHETLWTALQFGGTGRFGDRSGLGRFGMGLPNSSVSQSRRVEVYTWRQR